MRPSIIVSRLQKLFPEITQHSDLIPSSSEKFDIEVISKQKPAFKKLITALRQKADGKDISLVWKDVYNWFLAHEDWKKGIDSQNIRNSFTKYTNIADKINEGKNLRIFIWENLPLIQVFQARE